MHQQSTNIDRMRICHQNREITGCAQSAVAGDGNQEFFTKIGT